MAAAVLAFPGPFLYKDPTPTYLHATRQPCRPWSPSSSAQAPTSAHHVAQALQSQKYKVALGSRKPRHPTKLTQEGFFPVKVDITLPDSVSAAYKTVSAELGAPSVVGVQRCAIRVGACACAVADVTVRVAAVWRRPEVEGDPLSVPLEDFQRTLAATASLYSVAQDALQGFRSLTSGPKAFIVTGNVLPFLPRPHPVLYNLQTLKLAEAHLTEVFYDAYIEEEIRFHFALAGQAHAKVYWELISSKEPKAWDYRFTIDGKEWNKAN
ncbi:hypothetical protein IW261DRAFT_1573039 [Armillaria novae-zelandiae]|uniref:Uncharacterized protein n=1 Tax=Armillaria novae-zelandiae TaxID=153914 RepID=A0AA39NRP8_9AGAR|nr:hypothetical protein IW261DRAFT_1573039 [Armillaria novae-zelandiae]